MRSNLRVVDWTAEPGETILCRSRVSFASGCAVPVSGLRWFRNTSREDIQHELPGWPEGPVYMPHSTAQRSTRRIGRVIRTAVPGLLNIAVGALGGGGSPFGDPSILGTSDDPDNEVHDFPVMWADPGTQARAIPWQLDPARRAQGDTTHMVITDRRLVLLLQPADPASGPKELTAVPRALIESVRTKTFGYHPDTCLTFHDGSWVRLSCYEYGRVAKYLDSLPVFLTEEQLTIPQQGELDAFLDRWLPYDEPLITRAPEGYVVVEVRAPEPKATYGYLTQSLAMDDNGENPYRAARRRSAKS